MGQNEYPVLPTASFKKENRIYDRFYRSIISLRMDVLSRKEMMKLGKIFICISLLIFPLLMLTGCEVKRERWPRIVYQPTYRIFDDRIINIDNNYILDDGHSYDIVETENGYDLILHFIAE